METPLLSYPVQWIDGQATSSRIADVFDGQGF